MSLGSLLTSATRQRIPINVLRVVPDAEQIVVENIVNVAVDTMPFLKTTEAAIECTANTYRVTIPISGNRGISEREMHQIAAYNPGRIDDIRVDLHASGYLTLTLTITDEKTPYTVSEYDIVRTNKRRRISSLTPTNSSLPSIPPLPSFPSLPSLPSLPSTLPHAQQ